MTDVAVAVLGSGLAGATAGLAAARHRPDAAVAVLPATDPGFGDGLLRILGVGPSGARPVVEPLAGVAGLPDEHPYRLLGLDALGDGLALFDEVTSGDYCGAESAANALVPTFHGRVTPAARYPAAVAPGLASREAVTLLVGFEALPDLAAPLAARRLRAAGVPFSVQGITVDLPVEAGDEPPALRIAGALDENPAVDGVALRAALADLVRPHLATATRVGFPAVLGRTETAEIHAALGAALDADVFEVPLPPPHLPGRRLRDSFESALAAAGVRYERSVPTVAEDSEDGIRIEVEGGRSLRAGALVLATGGLPAGGVVADRTDVREPLLDLHVPHPGDRLAWSEPAPFGDHAFARFGVRIDGDARPLDARGEPEHDRLFAAGRVVGGHDFAAEGSQGGVALATATVAGRRAAEVA